MDRRAARPPLTPSSAQTTFFRATLRLVEAYTYVYEGRRAGEVAAVRQGYFAERTALSWQGVDRRRGLHLALRWLLGLTLVATSVGKALDLGGFHDVMRTYDLFPGWSLWPITLLMPLVEASIALCVLTGWKLRRGIVGSVLLHASFTVILTLELVRGLHLKNCGCFGVFLARPLTWLSPIEDLVMLSITLGIFLTLPRPAARRA